ncbi:MAG: glycosyltransferase family A protein [Ignavibacteria bacterium]|nr:glycosyltransferase family A protein [Ignavibacteria bacterium]
MLQLSRNNKLPALSIILPFYNRKKLINRAIDSVLNQSITDFELILADDGSTDKAYGKISKYLLYDYRIKYIRHSNRETPLTLNTGLLLAQGKYVTFLDSDDEYGKNHLELRMDYFRKNKNTDIIYSNTTIIGKEEDMWVPDARDRKKLIHLNDCIIGATLFGKTDVFIKMNGFRNIYSYDFDFVNRVKRKYTVRKFESPTYIYHRESKDSILTKLKKGTK